MFTNVVVGVDDYAAGHRALELANALVSRAGRITLVYVEVVQTEPAPELDAPSVEERQRFGLERLRRLRDRAQISADVARIQAASVRRGLHEFAASRAADLIVIGASSRNKVARAQLGDDVSEVLEDPPCPVAIAPIGYSGASARMRTIGVAYDGSLSNERALAVARRIAAEHRAALLEYEAVAAPMPTRIEAIRRFGASVGLLVLGSPTNHPPEQVRHRSTPQRVADEAPSPLLVLASWASDDADTGDDDEWRLRIDLHAEGRARELIEHLQATGLEHDLSASFHDRIVVSRDGGEVFCYAGTRDQAEHAEHVIRSLAAEHAWHFDAELQRWHPIAEEWEDPDTPLPVSEKERARERATLMERERAETEELGSAEFEVRVVCRSRRDAAEFAERLRDAGVPYVRRFRYVVVGATDEDSAEALATRLNDLAPTGSSVTVEGSVEGVRAAVASSPFAIF